MYEAATTADMTKVHTPENKREQIFSFSCLLRLLGR